MGFRYPWPTAGNESRGAASLVDVVAMRRVGLARLDVLIRVRLAGAGGAGRSVRLVAERLTVGTGRIPRIGALVIRVRPLGRIRIAGRVVQHVVRIGIPGAVPGILARGLGEAGGRLAGFGWFVWHGQCQLARGKAAQTGGSVDRGVRRRGDVEL